MDCPPCDCSGCGEASSLATATSQPSPLVVTIRDELARIFFQNDVLALDERGALPDTVRKLGSGSFGTVYATRLGDGRQISVKVMSARQALKEGKRVGETKLLDMLIDWHHECYMMHQAQVVQLSAPPPRTVVNAAALAALRAVPWEPSLLDAQRPTAPQIYGCYEANGGYLIAMEYVDGKTLKQLRRDGPRPTNAVMVYAFAQAFEYVLRLHAFGFYFNDISQNNIMLQPDGRVRLVDWGAACNMNAAAGLGDDATAVCKLKTTSTSQSWSSERFWAWRVGDDHRVRTPALMQKADIVALALVFTSYLQQRESTWQVAMDAAMDEDYDVVRDKQTGQRRRVAVPLRRVQPGADRARAVSRAQLERDADRESNGTGDVDVDADDRNFGRPPTTEIDAHVGQIPLPDPCWSLHPAFQRVLNELLQTPRDHALDVAGFLRRHVRFFDDGIARALKMIERNGGNYPTRQGAAADEDEVRQCALHRYLITPDPAAEQAALQRKSAKDNAVVKK